VEIGPSLDWFIIKRWPLDSGWTKQETQILVLLPGGYPTTPPDNFYADPDLRLANGSAPGNTSPVSLHGAQWLHFSFHVESDDWQPHADPEKGHNLLTFLEGVARRLTEAS
jgi:hypothetical protein